MVEKLKVYISSSKDIYHNLATEEYLFQTASDRDCVLFLWVNEPTVVVGRNQNLIKECDLKQAKLEGVKLSRRKTGGGAVFQDLGNINYSFIYHEMDLSECDIYEIVKETVRKLQVGAEKTGRNDLTIGDGRKFSGTAFMQRDKMCLQHGTMMVKVDIDCMLRMLTVSKEKLAAKGLDSVRSRVVNLTEVNPDISISIVRDALINESERYLNINAQILPLPQNNKEIEELAEMYASEKWIQGKFPL